MLLLKTIGMHILLKSDLYTQRTLHGAYGPVYPQGPRRPPLRQYTEAHEYGPPLPAHGQTSLRQHSRGPPSFRSQSSASVAPRNFAHRPRYDNTSRTSSLSSVVDMYQEYPQPHGNVPDGFSVQTQPLYYDYTEQFEPEIPETMTPIQLPPPIAVGTMGGRQMVPSHELDGRLAMDYGQMDSEFFDYDSRQTQDEEVSMIGTGLDESEIETNGDNIGQGLQHIQSYISSIGSQESLEDNEPLDTARGSRARNRASDVDLLPSQIDRDSMDTFNPSLDIESKDAPAYDYAQYRANATPRTNKESTGKQVRVQDNETPSIRSEQGLILQDDFHEDSPDDAEVGFTSTGTETEKWEDPNGHRSFSEPAQGSQKQVDHRRQGQRFNTTHAVRPDAHSQSFSPRPANGAPRGGNDGDQMLLETETTGSLLPPTDLRAKRARRREPVSGRETPEMGDTQEFRHHRRNNAALRISTTSLARKSEEILPHMIPRCSTTAILSPKPISPVRQLRLKNSIPQLMKTLPPLPGDPGYTAPPSPPMGGVEDHVADILSPFKFTRPFTPKLSKKPNAVRSVPNLRGNDMHSPPKNAPKLRLKMRLSETASPISSETRPQTSGSNSTEKAGLLNDKPVRFPRKLKLRTPRNSTGSRTPETVRRDTAAQQSDIIEEISSQQPRDLFSLKDGVSSAIRQVGKTLSHTSQTARPNQNESSSRRSISIHDHKRRSSRGQHGYSQIQDQNEPSGRRRPRRLRQRISKLRRLLKRSSDTTTASNMTSMSNMPSAGEKPTDEANTRPNLMNIDEGEEASGRTADLSPTSMRSHLSQRIQSKLRNWVEGAKLAVRTLANRTHVK